MKRILLLVMGIMALVLAAAGVVLPLLPTTPFVLVAAWCFARSSTRFHRILLEHRIFGPLVRDWERHGVIPLKVKYLSTTMMLLMVSYPLIFRDFSLWLKGSVVLLILIALWYIWSRPSVPLSR